ncbi:bifunctional DNA primase/polymerase [Streptomyces sp. NPDC090025]|uniref:bifunctional DNA primase/polymerase n=1 Tax=Streptomyces sp. NPDC090025 TaxID=3365922 RepID=UPI003838DCEA
MVGRTAVDEALRYGSEWGWPVLPGVGLKVRGGDAGQAVRTGGRRPARWWTALTARRTSDPGTALAAAGGDGLPGVVACACPDPECVVPGAHPLDPGLLAATTDARMIGWWWGRRPDAPVLLATGGRAPCAVSLPAVAGGPALDALDALGMRLGPVVATPTRWAILVAPYGLERLGDLLYAKDSVPSSLRFHSEGGYLPLPPSTTGTGRVRWERAPLEGSARPWLPDVEAVVDALVEASTSAPGGGSRLAY